MSYPLRCCSIAYSAILPLLLLLLSGSTLGIQGACAAMLEQHSNTIIHNGIPSACQTTTTATVAGLGQRPLRELLWSCFIAIAVSSVVSIHPNVPARDAKTQSTHGTFKRLVLILWALVAPEIVMLWAVRQWIGAKRIAEEFKGQGWTMAHGHLMQMGGFVLYDERHCAREVLEPNRFKELLLEGWIEFPRITEEEIMDMSKSDALFKGFSIFQTLWIIVQCFARSCNGYMLTGVELVAASSVISNAVLYFLWWNKPLDIRCPVPVYLIQGMDNQKGKIKEDAYSDHTSSFNIFGSLREMSGLSSIKGTLTSFNAIAADISVKPIAKEIRTVQFVSVIIAMTSSLYYLAWISGLLNFPTLTETVLWKVCATTIAGTSFALLLHSSRILTLRNKTVAFLIDVYVVARILVVLGSLFALRRLPVSALNVVSWTSYLPHM